MTTLIGLGLMSGTSCDGLDIAAVEFTGDVQTDVWTFRFQATQTVAYSATWRERLSSAPELSGRDLIQLHYDYSRFMGQAVHDFIECHSKEFHVDFVASHGHTVFHQPDKGVSFQLGDGEVMASFLKCPVVDHFRMKDVSLGGQGAPLCPSGERFLYSNVAICLNLGGIANLGVRDDVGWDIVPCNIVFNKLAAIHDPKATHDQDGELASRGQVLQEVLRELNSLEFYSQLPPKSLGKERIDKDVWPLLDTEKHAVADLARTMVEHVVEQIALACRRALAGPSQAERDAAVGAPRDHSSPAKQYGTNRVLITGGGAHNKFLMSALMTRLGQEGLERCQIDDEVIDFKEAQVFAYLGLRCLMGKENVFGKTTGASENCIAGSIHQPPSNDPQRTSLISHFNRLIMRRQSSPRP